MLRFPRLFATALVLLVSVLGLGTLAGCGGPSAPVDPHAGHDHGAADDTAGEYAEALAGLAPADRELAEKQQICPVSEQPLGSMGTPVKVKVEGRDVLLCCAGCQQAIEADPQKYLAKLPD
ncbi:MAG: hypothetical protein RBS80_16500 [Thermoguttaceae bacterium]|nr:hypothetical protein [Thermoguttaceae bacterium]